MHLFKTLLIFGQGFTFTRAAGTCNADNCARAVTGTAKGVIFQSSAKNDCQSFLLATTRLPAVTSTSTTTIFPITATQTVTTQTISETAIVYPFTTTVLTTFSTATSTTVSNVVSTVLSTTTVTPQITVTLRKRTTSTGDAASMPTSVPLYASACSGTVRYSSACSCFGLTMSTTTLAAPTTTTVLTVTGLTTTTKYVAFTNTQTLSLTTSIISSVVDSTITTATSSSTTTSIATATACVPSVPSGNILTNPGFNDGTFSGWNPGGYGAFSYAITDDAQCGAYGARFTVSGSSSYARIGQRLATVDTTKNYRIDTYAKLVSGDGTNCFYYLSCQQPGSFSSAGNPRLDTPLNSIPTSWTKFSLNCPPGVNQLTMSLTIQCNQGTGPVTIGIDETAMYPI